MITRSRQLIRRSALCGTLAATLLGPTAARAQSSATGDTAVVKLIQILIQKGILTSGQAASLLSQAQAEAVGGAAPAAPTHRGRHAPRTVAATTTALPAENTAEAPPPAGPPGEVRVTYVPQFVRDQIAAEVRSQVLGEVQAQGWAAPHTLPDWVSRVTVYGDLRVRYQGDYENKSNADLQNGLPVLFPNFNTINAGSGYDQTGNSGLPPLLNVTENRARERVRARIGVRAQIADWISTDIRIATGNDNSPVSENQTLGQPGDFSKYAIYIDRAYVNMTPVQNLSIQLGRTPNPYFVSDLMYAPDLNFDGAAVQYTYPLPGGVSLFFNGGAHPVFNEALNFSSTDVEAGSSHNAYLLAAQAGARWAISQNYVAKFAAGYFNYSNITGKLSAPCLFLTSSTTCSTDDTRPTFLQFGNTLFGIRDFVTNASSLPQQPQYYGLSSHFGVLDLHGRFDIHNYDPIVISLEGEFADNLAFNRGYILARMPVNNFGSNNDYQGGNIAYLAKLTVGYPEISKLWDWNVSFAYKYLESDSVVDAFTDPDFHLGGTNAKGYVIGGNLGIANDTFMSARWLSAVQVSGPPYGNDVLQIDLNTKF
jgi:hypothetical protein